MINLKEYNYPEITDIDLAWPSLNVPKDLLEEATARGYGMMNCPKFDQIFYSGGELVYKKKVDEEYRTKVFRYLKVLMSSWASKHEHKSAVCEMLLDEIVEKVKPRKD